MKEKISYSLFPFRYDSDGQPLQVMLLDLQVCRKASLATDLNYFLYTSLSDKVRRPNMEHFLHTYYNYFKEVMEAGGKGIPFSEEELVAEFRAKNKFGAIFGMVLLPMLIVEDEGVPDMEMHNRDYFTVLKGIAESTKESLNSKPHMKDRFLGIFDEFLETGIIEWNAVTWKSL